MTRTMTPEQEQELREMALGVVRRATARREEAERAWIDAIRGAVLVDKCSLRAVGDAAGVVHTRIHQLVAGRDAAK